MLPLSDVSEWVEEAINGFAESDLVTVSPEWLEVYRSIPNYLAQGQSLDDRLRWLFEATGDSLPDMVDHLQRLRRHLIAKLMTADMGDSLDGLLLWFDKTLMGLVERIIGKASVTHSLSEPYETVFWKSRDGMYISTVEGRFVHCNDAFVQLLRYKTADELLSIDIANDLYVDREERAVMIKHLFRDGFYDRHEFRFTCADGSERTALESCYLVSARSGVQYVVGMVVDVTSEKESQRKTQSYVQSLENQAMEAGVDANRELRRKDTLLTVSDHPLLIVDAATFAVLGSNQAFKKRFGYRKKDLDELSLKTFFSEADWMEIFPKLADLRRKNHFHIREVAYTTSEGGQVPARLSVAVHHENQGTSLFIEFNDVSSILEAKAISEALRRQMDAVIDYAPLGIIGFNGDGKVMFINQFLRRNLGYSKGRMRSTEFLNELFTIPEQKVKFGRYVQAMLSGRQYRNLPISLRSRSGDILEFALNTMSMDFQDGSAPGFLAFLRPTLLGGESEDAMQEEIRARDEHIEAMESEKVDIVGQSDLLTQLLEELVDQVKNPLEVIGGFVGLLNKDLASKLSPGQQEDFQIITTNIDILSRMLEQAREFERLVNDQVKPRFVDLGIHDLIDYLKQALGSQGKALNWPARDLPNQTIRTDPLLFESSFRQVIENAMEFTKGSVNVELLEADQAIKMRISDPGPGMNPVDLEHAANPFYAVAGKERGAPRLGLGLALMKRYCDLINIEVAIDSSVKGGTQVSFQIATST